MIDKTPSLVSWVEWLHPRHPFRLIFEQTRKNLDHVGISLVDCLGQESWMCFFLVPHEIEEQKREISVLLEKEPDQVAVLFEQEAVQQRIEYILTFSSDHFTLEYSFEEDSTHPRYWGEVAWYKNGSVVENSLKIAEFPSGKFVDDLPVSQEQPLELLNKIIEDQEAYFRIAQPDSLVQPEA